MPAHLNYEAFQNDIVARLGGLNTPTQIVDIVPLPETEAEFKATTYLRPRITVCYTGSDYTGSGTNPSTFDIGDVEQEELVGFHLTIESKILYGASGIYGILQKTRELLLGYSPTNCDKIHFKRSQVQRPENSKGEIIAGFVFVLEAVVKTYAIETDRTDTAPPLSQTNYLSSI